MSHSFHLRSSRNGQHVSTTPSPLRYASNASSSSEYSGNSSNPFHHSRTSTATSTGSFDYRQVLSSHKRGISETSPTRSTAPVDYHYMSGHGSTPLSSRPDRQSLKSLSQAPNVNFNPTPGHERPRRSERSEENENWRTSRSMSPTSPSSTSPEIPAKQQYSVGVSRTDSRRARHGPSAHHGSSPGFLEKDELEKLGRSSTKELKALSRFAENSDEGDFSIMKPDQGVVGMHGRRRLQRSHSTRAAKSTPGYGGRTWMDTQRQFLQAYEYLCHIGEAKEWIEDVIHHDIPPIVQLEEGLRDGVVLAEIVQTLQPTKQLRIFRNARLQFRHSDNIAIFFRFLAEVELPELFRFELVDLYEKKNIPKVIYCIHALSWLLLRKGIVNFRIGNLVGQLQFEDHELEATQKGLDKAGVSMPNFSGMGEKFGAEPEPPPEPVETEHDRISRELREHQTAIGDLQGQIRGALERLRLGETMQHLWDHEGLLVDLQARVRGDFSRQISGYRLKMQYFAVNLQRACKGFLIRSQYLHRQKVFGTAHKEIVHVQSLLRGRKSRLQTQYVRSRIIRHEPGIKNVQAAIRGALTRRDISDHLEEQRLVEPNIINLQRRIRGALHRMQHVERVAATKKSESKLVDLQAGARALLLRNHIQKQRRKLSTAQNQIVSFQAHVRGMHHRLNQADTCRILGTFGPLVLQLQAQARGNEVRMAAKRDQESLHSFTHEFGQLQSLQRGLTERQRLQNLRDNLIKHEVEVEALQSSIRGFLTRVGFSKTQTALRNVNGQIMALQACSRGYLARASVCNILCELHPHENAIINLQSVLRAEFVRSEVGDQLEQLFSEEHAVIDLQAEIRGNLVRQQFAQKQAYFEENMKKVIKIQSYVRGKQQGEAYKSLTSGKNPPVNTIKNFVHLLNDSDLDFEEEVEVEKLRKAVGSRAREIEQTEQWITELDAKIGLLAHNKISRDESAKIRNQIGSHRAAQRTMSVRETFNTKTLNKSSRAKLELYQQLFVVLQTQTVYLARLFRLYREQGASEDHLKRLELLTMSTYGFAQKRREEFYLLGLIATAIMEEARVCPSLSDFQRCTFFFTRLFNNYTRLPRDRKYIREINSPLIRSHFLENEGLDLESDPLQIYNSLINDEELRTGRRSSKQPNVSREHAIRDKEVRDVFVHRLQQIRDIVDNYFLCLEDSINRAPYGARFIARQMFQTLCERYPKHDQADILQFVGNWLWKTYFRSALADPEKSGTVDRALDGVQKRNLGELVKVMNQVASGKHFGEENVYLQPLNAAVGEYIERLNEFWARFIEVSDAEVHFEFETMEDIHAKNAPTLYIKMSDVFTIHRIVAENVRSLCVSQDDADLAEIVRDLGSAKSNEIEMTSGSTGTSSEVTLTLSAKLHDRPDPDADVKALFMETKRCILYIIRVEAGANLMDIMVKPITEEEELRWQALVAEEQAATSRGNRLSQARPRHAYTNSTGTSAENSANLADLAALSYPELKGIALENILALEQRGRLTRSNNYQDLLNGIALDIRQKHKRRIQRAREAEGVRTTLSALDEKARFLDEKLEIFNRTFEQGLTTLQSKSQGKKRFLMPFSTQWNHERELERLGRVPKYGSFKYKAQALLEKGILISWRGRDLRDVEVTIASDEVNVFSIEGSRGNLMLPGACATFTWDDLLEAQYQEQKEIKFFGEEGAGGAGGGMSDGVGELVLDARSFMQQVSKKFWPEG